MPFATGMVKSAIFSGVVNERLFLEYEFDDFFYKSEAEAVVEQVEQVLQKRSSEFMVESVYSYFGENRASSAIVLSRKNLDDDEAGALRKRIREALPEVAGARMTFRDEADEGGSSTYFAVKLFGQDSTVLHDLAEEVARRLETVAGIEDVSRPRSAGRREIHVAVDRDRAAELGLTADDVARLLAFSLGGLRLDRFSTGEREITTWLALRQEDRSRLDDLKQIPISSRGGRPVLLGDLATFSTVERPREIERENRKVRVAVPGTYEGDDWKATKKRIEELMNALELPAGYSWGWNDRIVEQQGENAEMGVNFALALILVYLVMASLFESLTQPLAILAAIPFALPGVAWMLGLTGTPLNLMAQIGILILMGIVVNNGIVLMDRVNQYVHAGLEREAAILAAGRDRLRPILMTAATTIIGLLPLSFGGASVAGLLYYPMARTVMGGLLSSVALTLVVLPYLSLGVEGAAAWAGRLWRQSRPAAPAPDAAPERSPWRRSSAPTAPSSCLRSRPRAAPEQHLPIAIMGSTSRRSGGTVDAGDLKSPPFIRGPGSNPGSGIVCIGLTSPASRPPSRRVPPPPASGRTPANPLSGLAPTGLRPPWLRPPIAADGVCDVAASPGTLATRPTVTSEWPYANQPPLRPGSHQACDPHGYGHTSQLSVSATPTSATILLVALGPQLVMPTMTV